MLAPMLLATVSSVFSGLKYREIGPAISGGRVPAVAGSNRDPHLYYAGGAGGGVFKSTDGGASWTAVFDGEPVAPVGAIAIAPQDDRDVWVGTGESNPRNTVESGDGIYHSGDGGQSWQHLGLERSAHISSITIDPRDRRVVAVGVLGRVSADDPNRGVYVTRDGGAHWAKTLYVGPASGVSSLVRVPDRPSTLFAGVWQFRRLPWVLDSGGRLGGIYRSDDDGATWRKLSGNGLPSGLTGRIGLAASNGGRIYAAIQSRAGDLWRSDDGGVTWRKMPHSPLLGARPFYFSSVFVDPANRDRLINVALILSMSTDGGRTFHEVATDAGWDYHWVWWSNDGARLIVGNDEGVVLSSDGGQNFWQPYDLPVAQPYHVGFDRTIPNYRLCIGLQDDNVWCGPSSSDNVIGVLNRDWYQIAPGDGMWAVFDPTDPDYVWATSTNTDTGQVFLFNARTKQAYEVSPSAQSSGANAAGRMRYRFNWETPITFTDDGKTLVGGNVVFESSDHGQTWSVISPDLTRDDKSKQLDSGGAISYDQSGAEFYDTILSLATEPLDINVMPDGIKGGLVKMNRDKVIWAGTDDGLVQLTRDGGAHWQDVSPPPSLVPPWGRIMCIEPARYAPGMAFISVERHLLGDDRPYVLETRNYGKSWLSVAGDLPRDLFVRSIRQDPRSGALLYAGTNRGVWFSYDEGVHWQSLRLNMPAAPIYDLEIQPDTYDLIVASHGRGVWILDDLEPLLYWQFGHSTAVNLFPLRDAYRMYRWSPVNVFTGPPSIPQNEYIGENAPNGAIVSYYLAYAAKSATIEFLDADGHVVRRLDGKSVPKNAGINRTSWDLTQDGPVKWNGTFKQNQGPDTGAEVLPGTYLVRLTADGVTQTKRLTVKLDPRDNDPARAATRYEFLSTLYAQLSTIDTMLNQIDSRLRGASRAQAAQLLAFKHRLTYDPRNIEDLSGPGQLREGVLDLIARMSSSFQAPTATQTAQEASYATQLAALTAAYRDL